jgi:hypothetical protein
MAAPGRAGACKVKRNIKRIAWRGPSARVNRPKAVIRKAYPERSEKRVRKSPESVLNREELPV